MRLLLLVSALGAAHAQLQPNSPWPMRGQNLRHAANGLVAATDNSVVVLKYKTGGPILSSSPAVDADGTVYVGSSDKHLHAVNGDGTPKWTYETGGEIESSPAVGADGTVYVGSGDGSVYAVNAVGKLKWKYTSSEVGACTPDGIPGGSNKLCNSFLSSPAIGPDGTVYVASDDGYLYALYADGKRSDEDRVKWKYGVAVDLAVRSSAGFVVRSSPAVGADGTVYVNSFLGGLVAVSAAGKLKWDIPGNTLSPAYSPSIGADGTTVYYVDNKGATAVEDKGGRPGPNHWSNGGGRVSSSLAVGADGTVYFVSAYSTLIAVNGKDGVTKWSYQTQDQQQSGESCDEIGNKRPPACVLISYSSPAVGTDGTVYVGSSDGHFHAVNGANGKRKWKYKTGGPVLSSPAIGADGTVYVGSEDGFLYGFGLSADYVTSSLHGAQRALARNETESAVPKLQRLCDFNSSVHNPEADTFPPETVKLIETSCQLLANTRNSPGYGRAWGSFVTPLSFTEYRGRITSMVGLLQIYETNLTIFQEEKTDSDARIALAKDAIDGIEKADVVNWQGVLKRDNEALSAYKTEIVTIGRQMNSTYKVLQQYRCSLLSNISPNS